MRHARLGASGSKRWIACPGSPRLSVGMPEVVTEYQIEGTAAHALAEALLTDKPLPPHDDEMREGVDLFVNAVKADADEYGGDLRIEREVSLGLLSPPEEMFGTADVVLISGRTIRVYDLKYGRGVMVEVNDNSQTMFYLLGAVLAEYSRRVFHGDGNFSFPGEMPGDGSVLDDALAMFDVYESIIVQPRIAHVDGPVRRKSYTAAELKVFAAMLMDAARKTHEPDAPLVPGDHCRFCPAQAHCPELYAHAQLVAQTDFAAVPIEAPPSPEALPIELVGEFLSKVGILESWIGALKARAFRELQQGNDVPGFKLVPKKARRVWNDPMEVREWATAAGLDNDDYLEPRDLKSPAKIEEVVGKKNLPQELYSKVSSGVTLAPASDNRPAALPSAQSAFGLLSPGPVDAELTSLED